MAYSRWLGSRWYTYWRVQSANIPNTRDNAIFEVCGVASFSAKELRDDMDGCIETARQEGSSTAIGDPTPEEMEELRRYMLHFLQDVDKELPDVDKERILNAEEVS